MISVVIRQENCSLTRAAFAPGYSASAQAETSPFPNMVHYFGFMLKRRSHSIPLWQPEDRPAFTPVVSIFSESASILPFSRSDSDDRQQWKTVDACRRTTVDRSQPTAENAFAALRTETDPFRLRACTNSWIAPHNMEGFFMNMGDMVVKSGDWRTAQKIYMLAQGVDAYPSWPYRTVLEARIRDAEQNVGVFQRENGPLMFRSKFSCSACHESGTP